MAYQVTCPLCGQTISGDDEDALVNAADAHGDEREHRECHRGSEEGLPRPVEEAGPAQDPRRPGDGEDPR